MLSKIGIQFSKLETTDFETGTGTYTVLSETQQSTLTDWLNKNHARPDVAEMEKLIREWKDDSYCDRAQTHELIFKKALSITNQPVRNGTLSGRQPQGDEKDIASNLHEISRAFVEEMIDGDELTVYRGVGHCLPELAVGLFENPSDPSQDVSANALSNYTPSIDVAESFGRVLLEQRIEPTAVALAADCLYPYRDSSGNISKNHCELRVNGDEVSTIDTLNIRPQGTSRPLVELLKAPAQNTDEEHDIVAAVIDEMAGAGATVSTKAGKKLIKNWYSRYIVDNPADAITIHGKVQSVI